MLIDLSHHNADAGPVDWARLPASVQGVYVKITEGSGYVDPAWTALYGGAHTAGLPVGAYHFADLANPIVEANHFADVYASRAWQLRPVLDVESAGASAGWINSFRAQFRKRVGANPFRVYSSFSLLTGALDPAGWIDGDTDIWIARYRATLGWDHPGLVLWQNTSTAHVIGFVGSVDQDQYQHGWTPAADQGGTVALTADEIAAVAHAVAAYRNPDVPADVDLHAHAVDATTALAGIRALTTQVAALTATVNQVASAIKTIQSGPSPAGTYPVTISATGALTLGQKP